MGAFLPWESLVGWPVGRIGEKHAGLADLTNEISDPYERICTGNYHADDC